MKVKITVKLRNAVFVKELDDVLSIIVEELNV